MVHRTGLNSDYPKASTGRNARPHDIAALTVLRGFAAYTVLFTHCLRVGEATYFDEAVPLAWAPRFIDLGTFGVLLFFALSGFTLNLNYGKDPVSIRSCASYIIRRIARIYPAYAVSFIVYIALDTRVQHYIGFHGSQFIEEFGNVPTTKTLVEYITLTFNFAGNWFYINNVYWSLPIEFQFYVSFPLFLITTRISWLLTIGFSAVLFVVSGLAGAQFITFQLAWLFAGGVVASNAFMRRDRSAPGEVYWIVLGSLLILAMFTQSYDWPWTPGTRNIAMAPTVAVPYGLLAIAAVWSAANVPISHRIRAGRLFRFMLAQGEMSYSIYLWHNFLLIGCYVAIVRFAISGALRTAIIYSVTPLGTALLAKASYRWIELPGIQAGRQLARAVTRFQSRDL